MTKITAQTLQGFGEKRLKRLVFNRFVKTVIYGADVTICVSRKLTRFKPQFFAVLEIFFCRRKAAVVLRKVYVLIAVCTVSSRSWRHIWVLLQL